MNKDELAPDGLLALIVNLVNGAPDALTDSSLGITLTVNGTMISGKLIPNWRWMQLIRDQFVDQIPAERDADGSYVGISSLFDNAAAHLSKARDEVRAAKDAVQDAAERFRKAVSDEDALSYLHLQDAKIWFPEKEHGLPSEGMLWRGRLAEVDGWSVGEYKTTVVPAQ